MIVTTHHRLTPRNARKLARMVKEDEQVMIDLAKDSKENKYQVRILTTEKM